MDPSSLNMIMVLKLVNKDLWDGARTVQKCTERASADATADVPAAASPVTSGGICFCCCCFIVLFLIFGGFVVDIIVKRFVYLIKLFVQYSSLQAT
jgi:hypothetical protein